MSKLDEAREKLRRELGARAKGMTDPELDRLAIARDKFGEFVEGDRREAVMLQLAEELRMELQSVTG